MSEFIERVEKLLEKGNKNKTDFYEKTGVSAQSFYDWKKRQSYPSGDTLVKIAIYLQTTAEYLITGNENPVITDLQNKIQKAVTDLQ